MPVLAPIVAGLATIGGGSAIIGGASLLTAGLGIASAVKGLNSKDPQQQGTSNQFDPAKAQATADAEARDKLRKKKTGIDKNKTILTSGQGLTDEANVNTKTLLG